MPRRETDSPNWGGARPDAGRKPTGRNVKTASFSLPAQLLSAVASIATNEGKTKSEVLAELALAGGAYERAAKALSNVGHAAKQARREAMQTEKEAL